MNYNFEQIVKITQNYKLNFGEYLHLFPCLIERIYSVSELEKYVLPIVSRYENKKISLSEAVDHLHKYDIEIAEWLSNNREKFKNFLTRHSKNHE
jgi:hypothetical protein